MSELKEKIKKFPLTPGVYRFLDNAGGVLYIGRATSLRRRVAQYFRPDLDPRIAEMVLQANNVKYQKTPTVLEAVILEANLIKKYWPKYNVKDRDDRSFIYIVLPKSDYPYPLVVRERELKKFPAVKNRIFGPYTTQYLVTNALKIIRRVFPYSACVPFSGKPCFDYQIGMCPGLCIGKISRTDYQDNIKNIILLLSGQKKRLMKKLKKAHPEKAAALAHLQDVSLITSDEIKSTQGINRIEGYDVSHLTGRETYGAMAVFKNGQPDKTQYRLFKIKEAPASDDLASLQEMITRRFRHTEWPRPDIIMIDGGKPQIDAVYKIMRAQNINIPTVGISKFGGDKLVFPPKTSKSIKDLTQSIKNVLLATRDEAHRFGNSASRWARRKTLKHENIKTGY